MKTTSVVRGDEHGVFVWANGSKYRPGEVSGYAHVYRMDDAGLKVGDKVKVRNVPCTQLCKVTTVDGVELRWSSTKVPGDSDFYLRNK